MQEERGMFMKDFKFFAVCFLLIAANLILIFLF